MKQLIGIQVIVSILLIPWLGGCDSSSNSAFQVTVSSTPPTLEKENNQVIPLSQTCINNNIGYQVNYPQGWQTNPGKVMDSCQVFDPESALVAEYTESTDNSDLAPNQRKIKTKFI